MKLTVVFDDRVIAKDGTLYHVDAEDWTLTQGVMHAIQWDGSAGHIEYNNGSPNQILTAESQVDSYTNYFAALESAYATRAASLASIDERYYVLGDLDRTTNTYASTPKSVATIKTEQIVSIKTDANSLIGPFDWYIIRYLELGAVNPEGTIPTAVTTYRAAVRAASNTACAAVTNAADFDELVALSAPAWPAELDPNTYYASY